MRDSSEFKEFAQCALSLGYLTKEQHRQALADVAVLPLTKLQDFFTARFGLSQNQCEAVALELKSNRSRFGDTPADPFETLQSQRVAADLTEGASNAETPTAGIMSRPVSTGEGAARKGGAHEVESRYRVLRAHARGGLGRVSVATDLELDRSVALKELLDQHADDPATRARFLEEAKITGSLEHPGIVPVYGLGTYADGRPYYAMRFVQGISLQDAIEDYHKPSQPTSAVDKRLELRKLLTRFVSVCNAIEYAHRHQIIHRDLKPSNIMLGQYGETLVVDWGLAKLLGGSSDQANSDQATREANSSSGLPMHRGGWSQTAAGSVVGTPQFMSPEQATGQLKSLGPACDIYSLGATLFVLLTGQSAVEGNSLNEVLAKVCQGDLKSARDVNRDVTKSLEAICSRAMSRDPAARYASAIALADDIEHFLADEKVSVYRESFSDQISRWTRRHRAWFQAISVSVVVVIGVLLAAIYLIHGQWKTAEWQRLRAEFLAIERAQLAEEQTVLRMQAEWQAARRSLEDSLAQCEREPAAGLLSLVENLREAERIEALDLQSAVRAQLARWSGSNNRLESLQLFSGGIRDILAHPDGRRFLVCAAGEPAVWIDAATGLPTDDRELAHEGGAEKAAISPSGKIVAIAGQNTMVHLWNLETQANSPMELSAMSSAVAMGFSPDEKRFFAASEEGLRIWSLENTDSFLDVPLVGLSDAVFSPVDSVIYSSDWSGNVRSWNALSGEAGSVELRHSGPVLSIAINRQGTVLAAGEIGNRAVLWDLASARPIGTPLIHQGVVATVSFSNDGQFVLTGSGDRSLRIWNVKTGAPLGSAMQHGVLVSKAKFSSNTSLVYSGGTDSVLRRWRLADGHSIPLSIGVNRNIVSARFHPTEPWAVTLSASIAIDARTIPGQLMRWSLPTGDQIGSTVLNDQWGEVAAISPDGRLICATLVSNESQAKIWDASRNTTIGAALVHDAPIKTLAFSRDSRLIVSGSEDSTARVWDASTGDSLTPAMTHEGRVSDAIFLNPTAQPEEIEGEIAVPADESLVVATGSWDQTVSVWRLSRQTVQLVWQRVHPSLVTAVAVNEDSSQLATGISDGTVRIWKIEDGSQVGEVVRGRARVKQLLFVDQETLLVGNHDGETHYWDLGLRLPIGPAMHHAQEVMAMAVSHDRTWALTASADWTARLWRLSTWSENLETIQRRAESITNLRRVPDGSFLSLTPDEWQTRTFFSEAPSTGQSEDSAKDAQ